MRTDYVAQALDIKYRTQQEKDELTQVGLANVSLLAQTATPTAAASSSPCRRRNTSSSATRKDSTS